MKQKHLLFTLAGILAVLLILYVALHNWNGIREKEEEEDPVYVTGAEDITRIAFETGEDKMSFTKTEDQWVCDSDTQIPIAQDTVQAVADAVGNLEAVRELKNPDDLKDYGLEEPSYTVDYTLADGTSAVLSIGNATGDNYYASVSDKEQVYTISGDFLYNFDFDIANYVQNDEVPSIGSDNLKKVTVEQNGEETEYTEEEQMDQLAGGFGALTLEDCVNYHASPEELEAYGLGEKERMTVTAVYEDSETGEEKTLVVYIGKVSEEPEDPSDDEYGLDDTSDTEDEMTRYLVLKDSNMVYLEGQAVIDNMTTYDEDEVSESEE